MIKYLAIYLCLINAAAAATAISDKLKAKKGKSRISEKTLLLLGLFGGALGEYITMRIIRHKTRHKKFMLGLPAEIILHIIILTVIYLQTAQII